MIRTLLICGLLAGVCGGILATGFAEIVGEPPLEQAISFEEAQGEEHEHGAQAAAGHSHEESAPVSRDTQRFVGLPIAAIVYGLAMGGFFALAFAFAYGRVGNASPAKTALWMAAAGFAVFFLVPFLKYPANPPATGDPNTVAERTLLFFTMLATSLLAAVAAARLRRPLVRRYGPGTATAAAIGAYLAIVVIAGVALPTVSEIPAGFPADALWKFRMASIGTQAVLWTTMGLVLAVTAPRALAGKPILQR
ncbi:MAG TPA: CbtA family protein [Solirubrobacterales bacterium]|nr:CbtA family protein [Solirubrobacterales bacterium]